MTEVFIAGGFGGDYDEVLADTEIYNLGRGSFTVARYRIEERSAGRGS